MKSNFYSILAAATLCLGLPAFATGDGRPFSGDGDRKLIPHLPNGITVRKAQEAAAVCFYSGSRYRQSFAQKLIQRIYSGDPSLPFLSYEGKAEIPISIFPESGMFPIQMVQVSLNVRNRDGNHRVIPVIESLYPNPGSKSPDEANSPYKFRAVNPPIRGNYDRDVYEILSIRGGIPQVKFEKSTVGRTTLLGRVIPEEILLQNVYIDLPGEYGDSIPVWNEMNEVRPVEGLTVNLEEYAQCLKQELEESGK